MNKNFQKDHRVSELIKKGVFTEMVVSNIIYSEGAWNKETNGDFECKKGRRP